ncbi:MAG: aryl-sulfate sulfotransferase [Polyangiaceae bacterium]|nr:aryl-sulfate sulfotransferase [Polyangiaceae bacterium]
MKAAIFLRRSAGFIAPVMGLGASLVACSDTSNPKRPAHVTAEVSDRIATVVQVRWTTDDATTGCVEYGPTHELGQATPRETEAAQEHEATLLGLSADSDWYYRVATKDGASVIAGDVASVRTGVLPVGLPPVTQTGKGQQGFIVAPVIGTGVAVIIMNAKGEIVWYWTDERELDVYRARLSADGKSLLYNAARVSGTPSEASELVRVALDGSGSSSVPIPFLAHDFVEHPNGTLAAIAVEYRDSEGSPLAGNKIVEVAPGGTQRTVWSAWDCFDPAAIKGDDMDQGWTFANALDYDAAEDVYYLGMRNFSSIVRIDRKTRACEWVLGLGASTFAFASGADRFLHQHQFQVRGNHILIMDNDGAPGNESRLLEYELDAKNQVATQVWSYVSSPSVYTFVFGEPLRFVDGSTFINWGAAGQMERVNPTGESIWQLNTGAGFAFGFHTLADDLYSGADVPEGLSGT